MYLVNAMAADDLAPCVTRSSPSMALNIQHQWVLLVHKEEFQLTAPYQRSEMIENKDKYIFILSNMNSVWPELIPLRILIEYI